MMKPESAYVAVNTTMTPNYMAIWTLAPTRSLVIDRVQRDWGTKWRDEYRAGWRIIPVKIVPNQRHSGTRG